MGKYFRTEDHGCKSFHSNYDVNSDVLVFLLLDINELSVMEPVNKVLNSSVPSST